MFNMIQKVPYLIDQHNILECDLDQMVFISRLPQKC